MEYTELEKLAQKGELLVCRSGGNTYTRRVTVYAHKMPKIESLIGAAWDEYEKNAVKYNEIKEIKSVPYKRYIYGARTRSMQPHTLFKITKTAYQNLLKAGAAAN